MTDATGTSAPTPYRAIRETTGLSVREVSRRVEARGVKMNSGRLSVIERGVAPSDAEKAAIMAVLMEAVR
jgi:hypothetical protein